MKAVWKFVITPECTLALPQGAKILTIAAQDTLICMWALVESEALPVERSFKVFGTGKQIPSDIPMQYVGSAQLAGGGIVVHVFEIF